MRISCFGFCFRAGIDDPPRDEVVKLGLKLTDIISQCNVVVAAKFTRTVKMMYAVAKGIPVVSSKWITASAKAKKVLGELLDKIVHDESHTELSDGHLEFRRKARKAARLNVAGFGP